MQTSSSFHYPRFAALVRLDYGERRMSYCFFLLGAYLISAIALTAGSIEIYRNTLPVIDVFYQRGALQPGADPGWNVGKQYLTVAFFVFMLLSVNVFRTRAQTRRENIRALLLPATTAEKFMRWWLYAVPFSLAAFAVIFLASDFTRILICRSVFPGADLSLPLFLDPDLRKGEGTPLIFQTLFTLTLLGQSIVGLTSTLKTKPTRFLWRVCILALPVILVYSVAGFMRVYPSVMDAATPWLSVWHTFFLALTVLCWYAVYRRLVRRDLQYCPPSQSSAA